MIFTASKLCDFSDIINEISQPLFQNTDIVYFKYTRLYNNGSFFILNSRADILQYITDQKLYLKPTEIHLFERYLLMSLNIAPSERNVIHEVLKVYRDRFQLGNFFYINDVKKQYIQSFVFATQENNHDIISYYLNNKDILDKYSCYFMDKAAGIIQAAHAFMVQLPEWALFIQEHRARAVEVSDFEDTIIPERLYISDELGEIHFTKREFECLRRYARGSAAKVIAYDLGISPRTVECHIDNIKRKLGCHSKSQLLHLIFLSEMAKFI